MKPRYNLGKRVIVPALPSTSSAPILKPLTVREIMKLIIEHKTNKEKV